MCWVNIEWMYSHWIGDQLERSGWFKVKTILHSLFQIWIRSNFIIYVICDALRDGYPPVICDVLSSIRYFFSRRSVSMKEFHHFMCTDTLPELLSIVLRGRVRSISWIGLIWYAPLFFAHVSGFTRLKSKHQYQSFRKFASFSEFDHIGVILYHKWIVNSN